MIEVECWLEGTMPLLQHRMADGALEGTGSRRNTVQKQPDPRDVAEAGVYRIPGTKHIGITGSAIARMLREAGSNHKAQGSRKSIKYIVPAAVIVLNELCALYQRDRATHITDFEVDSRPVVIPATKGRVMRHRARFNEWAVCVHLRINETILAESVVRQLMVEGTQQIGLGDYRPERGGPFGLSDLVSWDVLSDKKRTKAQRRNAA